MEATFLLADWAEAINGKLYVQGGGWTSVSGDRPLTCAIAVLLLIGWNESNQQHKVTIRLVTEGGEPVEPEPGRPVVIESAVEVGRPAGTKPGSDLGAALALRIGASRLSVADTVSSLK